MRLAEEGARVVVVMSIRRWENKPVLLLARLVRVNFRKHDVTKEEDG